MIYKYSVERYFFVYIDNPFKQTENNYFFPQE